MLGSIYVSLSITKIFLYLMRNTIILIFYDKLIIHGKSQKSNPHHHMDSCIGLPFRKENSFNFPCSASLDSTPTYFFLLLRKLWLMTPSMRWISLSKPCLVAILLITTFLFNILQFHNQRSRSRSVHARHSIPAS